CRFCSGRRAEGQGMPSRLSPFAIGAALGWLDDHAGWPFGASRAEVAARLVRLDPAVLRSRRERVARPDIAAALAAYYPDLGGDYGRYAARYRDIDVTTSVLTSPGWLDLACPRCTTPANASPSPPRTNRL